VAKKVQKKKLCFAVTPIGGEGTEIRRRSNQVLKYIIEPVMGNLDHEVERADRISQPGMITHQVIEHLIDDELVVADLTGSNPNVFYELAIRHATRKPVITIIEEGERIPFDVNQSRTIHFTYQDLDSVDACKSQLASQVRALEGNPTDFFTPVSVAIDLKAMYESGVPEERRDAQVLAVLQEVQAEMSNLGAEVASLRGRVEYLRVTSTEANAQKLNFKRTADALERLGLLRDTDEADRLVYRTVDEVLEAVRRLANQQIREDRARVGAAEEELEATRRVAAQRKREEEEP
jgi:hypothetical protein